MSNELIQSDNKLILEGISENYIDLILTDPPYQISKKSNFSISKKENKYHNKYKKHTIDYGEWDKIDLDWNFYLNQFYRILKPNGQIIMFYDVFKIGQIKEMAESIGFKQPRICVWVKTNPTPVNSNSNYLSNAKEYMISFTKKEKPIFNSKYDNGVYNIPKLDRWESVKHPTQKPLKLMEDIILKHSDKGSIILDPFCGSGSTLVAANNLERKWIGIENNPEYIDICKSRLNI